MLDLSLDPLVRPSVRPSVGPSVRPSVGDPLPTRLSVSPLLDALSHPLLDFVRPVFVRLLLDPTAALGKLGKQKEKESQGSC